MKRLVPLSFWFVFALTTAAGVLCARRICPAVTAVTRPKLFSFRDKFLGSYGPVSLDELILANNILDAAEQVKSKDLLLLGSSKMMYGVDAGAVHQLLKSKGVTMATYNLAFGHGEGLVFPAWLIRRMGIRNKLLIIDATDNTAQYHIEPEAQAAMKSAPLDAWKTVIETNIQFRLDWVLHSVLPRGIIAGTGIGFEANYLRPAHWRDWHTGDVYTRPGANAYAASPGTFPFPFDPDQRLRQDVFRMFRDRNLHCDFISIPYVGNDPAWSEKAAALTGCKYIPVGSPGLYTVDKVHLNKQSRDRFTQNLVNAIVSDPSRLSNRSLPAEGIH